MITHSRSVVLLRLVAGGGVRPEAALGVQRMDDAALQQPFRLPESAPDAMVVVNQQGQTVVANRDRDGSRRCTSGKGIWLSP